MCYLLREQVKNLDRLIYMITQRHQNDQRLEEASLIALSYPASSDQTMSIL